MNLEKYSEDILSSLFSIGNNYRFKKSFEKENIKMAFVGGSITKGWNGTHYVDENFTKIFYKHMCETYKDKNILYSNYSTESANSFIGLSIMSKLMSEADSPDIIFVEYAVNNECTKEHIISFESLIHMLLNMPSKPAVILLLMINQSMYTSQGYMKKIGEHYGLPMISIADTLKNMMSEKSFEWTHYSDDWVHPNRWGHEFVAECLMMICRKLISGECDDEFIRTAPLYSLEFSGYRAVPVNSDAVKSRGFICKESWEFFDDGLEFQRGTTDSFLGFEADFKNLFITYKHDKTDKFSDADIYIDGSKAAFLQGKSIYGWENITLRHVYGFEEKGHHVVEVRVKDSSKEFFLAEFGIC